MNRSAPLSALLAAVFLLSCSRGQEQVAGGDDMGNFLRAVVVDSVGHPLDGRIVVVSDVDSMSLELDPGGLATIPGRRRGWIALRSSAGDFLLDSPGDSGTLGALKVGRRRPLLGWLNRAASVSIPGVGVASREGAYFRFAAVPPGAMRLLASSDSFRVGVRLVLDLDSLARRPAATDSVVVPPLVARGSLLAVASRDDTSACGAACPSWLWSQASALDDSLPLETYVRLRPSASLADTALVRGVSSVDSRGSWLLLRIDLKGVNTAPRLWISASDTLIPHRVEISGEMTNDTLVVAPADTAVTRNAALRRRDDPRLLDSLLLVVGGIVVPIPPADRTASDSCPAGFDSLPTICGGSGRNWRLQP